MRLGKDAMVFTRCMTSMSVGFLSQTYLEVTKADAVIVPIVTWNLPSNILFFYNHMGLYAIKPVFGISDQVVLKPACSATEIS